MRIECHDGFHNTQSIDATRVVAYDSFDNPIAVVIEVDQNRYVAATASNKKFQEILNTMGINKTLVVKRINTDELQPLI